MEAADNGWVLIPEQFPDKFFEVQSMEVTCETFPELNFTLEDVGKISTETVDDFTFLEDIYADVEMKNRQKILAQHTSIWYAESDDTWNTQIRVNGKRKLIKRKRKEDVEEKIVQYYRELENNPTIGEGLYGYLFQ